MWPTNGITPRHGRQPQHEIESSFSILALDGDGVRGTYAAQVLARVEQALDVKINECFDLIAGTSTGCIGWRGRPRKFQWHASWSSSRMKRRASSGIGVPQDGLQLANAATSSQVHSGESVAQSVRPGFGTGNSGALKQPPVHSFDPIEADELAILVPQMRPGRDRTQFRRNARRNWDLARADFPVTVNQPSRRSFSRRPATSPRRYPQSIITNTIARSRRV